ncbi:YczE/YyaS/YitT family protein [Lysinibacillus telephonicus]|uniref:YitT family protein n=2 Tax=Lysinibacillus telephonicus TaxID=1714840 RepID=A0A3S0JKS2_9BACI|nr:YitT family protein [Lysinibacillus telephonicus]
MSGKAKYTLYVLGILILTLGISFTIQSDLGTSPYDALLVGLSISVGLTVGSWEIIIALILICINSILRRQRPELLGVLTAIITGISIDMWLFLLHNLISPELWISKLIFFVVGLVVTGLGTAIYLQTHFAPMPIDRLTLIIQELTRTNIFISRTVIYLVFLVMAKLFNGPIGIGTILTVCLGGVILNYFMALTKNFLECLQEDTYTSSNYHTEKNDSI